MNWEAIPAAAAVPGMILLADSGLAEIVAVRHGPCGMRVLHLGEDLGNFVVRHADDVVPVVACPCLVLQ